MILNKKEAQNDTNYTSHNSTLMLKMVTSYSIFLLIILVLFLFLYRSTINNARDSYDQQNETTLISTAELFESDLNIMEVYCRQLLQNDTFRKVMNYENTYYPFTEMGNELQNSLATNVYAEALLPLKESFVYFPETDYVLNPTYFISAKRFYNWIQKYPASEKDLWYSYDLNVFWLHAEKPACLHHFQSLIDQSCRINGNLSSHGPVHAKLQRKILYVYHRPERSLLYGCPCKGMLYLRAGQNGGSVRLRRDGQQ